MQKKILKNYLAKLIANHEAAEHQTEEGSTTTFVDFPVKISQNHLKYLFQWISLSKYY